MTYYLTPEDFDLLFILMVAAVFLGLAIYDLFCTFLSFFLPFTFSFRKSDKE